MNRIFLKFVYLIRSILYLPLRLFIFLGDTYAFILKMIDRRNHDAYWQEIMQKSVDRNVSEKIKISNDKEIRFYCPSKLASFRVKTFFTKEPETIAWMNEYGSDQKTLYDVGANMGIYSIYYAKKFNADVYAFEPNFKNLDLLTKNIKLNSLEKQTFVIPNPVCENFIISDFFKLDSFAAAAHATFNDESTKNIFLENTKGRKNNPMQYKTLGLSLDNLIDLKMIKKPELIKIDVDGNEVNVLKGLKKTILKLKNVSVLIETHAKTTKKTLLDELEMSGLKKIKESRSNSIWEK